MITITIDGYSFEVPAGLTILQACARIGISIPRFCYHERLSISGNCRMCLVEVANNPKPVASCAMEISNGMVIHTSTEKVKKAREGVLEFLLANHPLDCPICDQGGECDLQDQVMAFGSDRGRFYEYKRAIEDMESVGPLIKTIMTRCIQCTRCVRFITEISGVEELGLSGRGDKMEIGTYIRKNITSEISANIIDLCPVGALTSKPYQSKARPWELKKVDSIDLSDGLGSNIRIDTRDNEILRVLPRFNNAINEEWISDKSRYSYDGLNKKRINSPYYKNNENKWVKINWKDAFGIIKELNPKTISGYISTSSTDTETMVLLRDLVYSSGSSNIDSSVCGFECDFRDSYILDTKLLNSDLCLFIGSNPRIEASMLNVRLRNRVLSKQMMVATIGGSINLTYPSIHLGNGSKVLVEIIEGRHPFCKTLAGSTNPTIIISDNYASLIPALSHIKCSSNPINVIHSSANNVGALELGITSNSNSISPTELLYVIGDEDVPSKYISNSKFIVFQSSHGTKQMSEAGNLILPAACSFGESDGIFVNTECRPQQSRTAIITNELDIKQNWKVVCAIAQLLNKDVNYRTIEDVRNRILDIAPNLLQLNHVSKYDSISREYNSSKVINKIYSSSISNFYKTGFLSTYSELMSSCEKIMKEEISQNYL